MLDEKSRIFEGRIISLYELMVYPKDIFPVFGLSMILMNLESSLNESGNIPSQLHLEEEYKNYSHQLQTVSYALILCGEEVKEVFPSTFRDHARATQMSKRVAASGEYGLLSLNELKQECYGLIKSFREEARKDVFLIIGPEKAKYYTEEKPFGEAVFEAFEEFREDISNASKCLAVDQRDAALYHAIGVMERCVRMLADKTRIRDFDSKEWGGLVGEMSTKNRGWNPSTPELRELRNKISEALAHFYNVNKAYRIYIAHKKASYKEEEAIRIYNMAKDSVQEFVRVSKLEIPEEYGPKERV